MVVGKSLAARLQTSVRCFATKLTGDRWMPKLKELVPSFGESLIDNPALCQRVRDESAATLHINALAQ